MFPLVLPCSPIFPLVTPCSLLLLLGTPCSPCSPLLGSKSGAVVIALASHQCGLGSNPGVYAIRGFSLLLVLSVTPRDFSPVTPTVEQSDLKDFKDCRTSQRDTSPRLNIVPLLSGISLFIPSKQSDVSAVVPYEVRSSEAQGVQTSPANGSVQLDLPSMFFNRLTFCWCINFVGRRGILCTDTEHVELVKHQCEFPPRIY